MNNLTTLTDGLYRPEFEKDNCGFGLIAQMDGQASHWLVQTAIGSLACLTHRGAIAPDGKTGDGCGLLIKKPDGFFRAIAAELGIEPAQNYAVGVLFLHQDPRLAEQARTSLTSELQKEGLSVAGWRIVPTNQEACGAEALKSLPHIEHIFVNAPDGMDTTTFDRHLYIARRRTEKHVLSNAEGALNDGDDTFYIPSLSCRVIAYKGLVMPANLPLFYTDLRDARFESALAVYHQRFSTNTWPQWRLAQPFRYLAHNGEINTVQGNRNWSVARGMKFVSPLIADMDDVRPLVSMTGSDSLSLDNMADALIAGGMDLFHAMRLLIPPAWENDQTMDPELRAFYEYHSMHMEPWDGPAGIVMTDGRYAACLMDRNGLRPARYVITQDRHITLASEIGVYNYAPEDVIAKGRLKPGQMIAADTATGRLLLPGDIDRLLKTRQPYRSWLEQFAKPLAAAQEDNAEPALDKATALIHQKLFNVSFEERDQVLRVLAENGQEAVGSMGDDTPMAVLSQQVRSLYDYFRQQFAQVTNPPIDPLREQIVMSLKTCFGRERNLFEERPEHAKRLTVASPVLSEGLFAALVNQTDPDYAVARINLNYPSDGNLRAAIERVCDEAERAVKNGKVILVLSDRAIAKDTLPIHALLATGAIHHRLIKASLRCDANLVVETGTARDPHHIAVLIGYGATAVFPYLAYECLRDMMRSGEIVNQDVPKVLGPYRKGVDKALYKIISKMGIATIASYRGAQLFEAVGLHDEVVELCFRDTVSRLQGTDFAELESDQRWLAKYAWNPRKPLAQGGLLKFIYGGEYHAYNPDVVMTLQAAVKTGDYAKYLEYAKLVNERPVAMLRDMLVPRDDVTPIPIAEVEAEESILPRFDSAGMSLGALSPEAHEALAIAMNRLGGRSNSGEGGEHPSRYGTERTSKIKQVAAGRFGVTPTYLVHAEVLQIKMAQGAKPGEGGQLPGEKVNAMIAELRYSRAGVALISPPPHHDIYSIEDLAQLIFDLKQVNPDALVSVKLVAEAGVGTVAAGVAKAYADMITISGYDGGTGASPLSSVKYAGSPWELGLSEAHQVLRANNLRDRVRLQTDGGLKTGLDVIKAAILGAESFGFGTAPLIALGCKYLRICHLNTCATGVATQHDGLRKEHFIGLPEMVENYFRFVARETREWLARLGVKNIAQLIGRTDLLRILPGETAKQQRLDLTPLLSKAGVPDTAPQYCIEARNEPFDKGEMAEQMVRDMLDAIEHKRGGVFNYKIRNINRSIGARLSGEIARRHGNQGMHDTPVTIHFTGSAGQSFGVWNAGGLHLVLEGDANDYVGKGMAGGKIVIYPPRTSRFKSNETTIIGNTCLYGATGGKLFAAGLAGERFAVRNSGARAVVEGIGDHGCEYMTGGEVVVLGATGLNFGAGMTGGFAYVLDLDSQFNARYNPELIDLHRISGLEAHRKHLRMLIEEFANETHSAWGRTVFDNFAEYAEKFWLVKSKAATLDTLLAPRPKSIHDEPIRAHARAAHGTAVAVSHIR